MKGDEKGGGPKAAKAEGPTTGRGDDEIKSDRGAVCPSEDMRVLLEEAGRMLKNMTGSSATESQGVEDTSEALIKRLQQQLDDLKGAKTSVKVLRIAKVRGGSGPLGLVDSGATHALRPQLPGERLERYRIVTITLAGDKQIDMRMSPRGVIIGKPGTEPIVPMGKIIQELGCTLQWTEDHMVIHHPVKGQIHTVLEGGCLMVPIGIELGDYLAWLHRLAKEHPALQGVPEEVRRQFVVKPEEATITGNRNRHLRRLWKKEGGVILYLYSGPNDGYTLRRAVRSALGGESRKVLEVDIKNGSGTWCLEGCIRSF